MKSITFFCTLAFLVMAVRTVAQLTKLPSAAFNGNSYTVIRWNEEVLTKINDGQPKKDQKFNSEKEIKFERDTKNRGLVIAVSKGNTYSFSAANGNSRAPQPLVTPISRSKTLETMSIDELFALINQDANVQNTQTKTNMNNVNTTKMNTNNASTTKQNTTNSDRNKTNTDRVKLDKANVNVIRQ